MRFTVRFSLLAVMLAVLYVAVVLTALRYANELWAGAMFTLVLILLLTGTLAAIFHKERRRAFWVGFSLFGWTMFIVDTDMPYVQSVRFRLVDYTLLQKGHRSLSQWLRGQQAGQLADGALLAQGAASAVYAELDHSESYPQFGPSVGPILPGSYPPSVGSYGPSAVGRPTRGSTAAYRIPAIGASQQRRPTILLPGVPDERSFLRVGHAAFTLLLAILGGAVGIILWLERTANAGHSGHSCTTLRGVQTADPQNVPP